jgi:adenosylcobinamide-GDP ribazoletransferase
MTPFWIALQFLTVLPIELKQIPTAKQNGQSVLFYPLVGLLIGLILFGLSILLVKVPIILVATIILVIWIWLTGGLHLDGLADTADAWVGGFGDRERTLKIMKDPSCGPIGVLSLVIVCLMKFSFICLASTTALCIFNLNSHAGSQCSFIFISHNTICSRKWIRAVNNGFYS